MSLRDVVETFNSLTDAYDALGPVSDTSFNPRRVGILGENWLLNALQRGPPTCSRLPTRATTRSHLIRALLNRMGGRD